MAKITDSKDIMDIAKLLEKKQAEYNNSDAPYGMELLTIPQYISSARSIMFTSHLKQMLTLNHPEFPRMCTNYENVYGKYSSSIYHAKGDSEVTKIINKFPKVPGHRYVIFFYDKKKDYYDCIIKKGPEELTEKFGYGFNTEVMDSLQEGDTVNKGETLYKSMSYDEDDNYCFGVNARTLYLIDNETIEDAVVCSESFSKRMESKEVETVKIGINDNDLLDNLYGDDKNDYKGFPDIGETIVNKLICSKRQINNDQTLFDLKKSNLRESNPINDKEYYSHGRVIDIDIYSNKPLEEIPDIACNQQIRYYLQNQEEYYRELKEYCQEIVDSGSKYCSDISFLLGRAEHILDPNYKWKDDDNAFSYMILEITVERDVAARIGYKLTGRYGNKGVISQIHPDDEMPIDEDGRPVDLIINSLSVINRLNSAQLFEISINHISDAIAKKINTFKTLKEKEDLLFEYVGHFNEGGECDQLKKYYKSLSTAEKKAFFAEINTTGIFINLPPISRGKPLFDIIDELYLRYPFIKPNTMYVKKWGRRIKMMKDVICGEEYIIKLKQTAKKNFSARSTGYLSQKGLPDKSNKSKHNQQLYPTTPIKIGRDENNNLSIGVDSKTLAKLHLFYRSSPVARREMSQLLTGNPLNFKGFKLKKNFTNRNVEILLAYLKSMGYAINYGATPVRIKTKSNTLKTMKFKNRYFIGTEENFEHYVEDTLRKEKFNEVVHVGPKSWVENEYKKFIETEDDSKYGRVRIRINKKQ